MMKMGREGTTETCSWCFCGNGGDVDEDLKDVRIEGELMKK